MTLGPFIVKETLHVIRDKRMLMVVLMIPVVQMLLFGFAISTEVNNVDIAVAWQEYSTPLGEKIDNLAANPYITLKATIPQSQIYSTLQRGDVNAVVLFKDADSYQVITDASNPNLAQSATAYITAILSADSPAMKMSDKLLTTRFLYNPQLKSAYNFVPGIMGMLFLLVCALMTAVSIVREKETGTMNLLLVSPVRPIQIIISKMVPFFVLSCIDLALIMLIARYMLDVPMTAGVWPVILVSVLYIILSLCFGLLVSTVSKSQVMAMLICGMVMILPVIMLSGLIYPIDNLPVVLKQISAIVPARWYIDAMRKLMIEGLPLADVADDTLILLAMTLVMLIVAVRKFKDRI